VNVDVVQSRRAGGEALRQVMRHHAAGVVVITTGADEPTGFCATSLTSVSLEPPTVAFAVASRSASGLAWRDARHGLVHVLRADQRSLAARFAGSGPEKFGAPTSWRSGPHGQPLLDGVLAWLLVSPRQRLDVGDHLMVVCDVEATSTAGGTRPLVYHDGGFHSLPA
jgi:flavin reductase (DIM6/NTAB) family NADH-FMN oxidoreductase RutF